MSAADAKIISWEPLKPFEARWTKLSAITYTDPNGQTRKWECASRSTRPATSPIDGVGIVAIFQPSPSALPSTAAALPREVQALGKPCLLLQKQFRPPANAVCIEVPAGLVDEGESAETSALRELKEETGYTGTVGAREEGWAISPVMWNDPGFCTTNLQIIHLTIDLSDPTNQHPEPALEDNEFIECFVVPLTDLYAECRRLAEQGYAIDARVGTLAEGIEMAKRWGVR